jgi:hypothetical protein
LMTATAPGPDGRRPIPSPGEYVAWGLSRILGLTSARNRSEFLEFVRPRVRRRRSAWNLLLLPACFGSWAVLGYATARGLGTIYSMAHAAPSSSLLPDDVGGLLVALGSLVGSFAPSMIVANCLLWLVPAARRTFEEEEPFPDLTFRAANQGFLRMTTLMTPIGVGIGIIGALLP